MNVKFSLKYLPVSLLVVFLSAAGAWAQGGAAPAGSAPEKVAALDVRGAIVATAEGKEAGIELQSKFAPKQTDLQNLQKQIEDLQGRIQNGAATLSDEEKASLQRQADLYSHELQRGQDDLQEQATAAQQDIFDRIGRKMLDVVDRYARENGIAVVLDSSAQGGTILYRADQVDITPDIVRLYDAAYPVKPAASATPPPIHSATTPKPATPQQ
jgi:outer membrane protein